jgi:hypothetical protein
MLDGTLMVCILGVDFKKKLFPAVGICVPTFVRLKAICPTGDPFCLAATESQYLTERY